MQKVLQLDDRGDYRSFSFEFIVHCNSYDCIQINAVRRIKIKMNHKKLHAIKRGAAEGLEKRYNLICKRNQRKGISEYTYEQFAAKMRKEEAMLVYVDVGTAILYVIAIIWALIRGAIQGGLKDGTLYCVVFMLIMGAICWWNSKTQKAISEAKLSVLEQCEREHISLSECVEKLYLEEE